MISDKMVKCGKTLINQECFDTAFVMYNILKIDHRYISKVHPRRSSYTLTHQKAHPQLIKYNLHIILKITH